MYGLGTHTLSEQDALSIFDPFSSDRPTEHNQAAGADGKKGTKRALDPQEEAKRKKRMERFGIVDEKAEAAAKAEIEVTSCRFTDRINILLLYRRHY